MRAKYCILAVMLFGVSAGCGKTRVSVGGQGHIDNPLSGSSVSVALTINTDGEVVLSKSYTQDLIHIGEAGVGWTASIDTVLYDFHKSSNSLFVLYEDPTGDIWQKKYQIGQPFNVAFNDEDRVREIRSDQRGNVLVVVKPIGRVPGYDDLRDDIRALVQRWDRAHKEADSSSWDTSNLDTVLRGAALQEQLSAVNWLRSRNCYWTIDELITPQIIRFDVVTSESLIVEVRKDWDMDLHCNGKKSGDDDGPFTMYYEIEKISGQWYITYKRLVSGQ